MTRLKTSLLILAAIFVSLPGAGQSATGVFTVTSTDDAVDANIGDGSCETAGGVCTLRAAIQEANAQPDADTIVLNAPPPAPGAAPRYQLTLTGVDEDDGASGDLDVYTDMSIAGQGNPLPAIDGLNLGDRVFDVFGQITVTLADLDIVNGTAVDTATPTEPGNGGGIQNIIATLTLDGVVVLNNRAALDGGGIFNFDGDVALLGGSVISRGVAAYGGSGNGAGIANYGNLLLEDAAILDNQIQSCGTGAGIYNAGSLEAHDVLLSNNATECAAGAIANVADAVATITESRVSSNRADDGAGLSNSGTATVDRTTFDSNNAWYAFGGAILNSGSLTITNSTLSQNHAEHQGGGIYTSGTLTATNLTIAANTASKASGANPFGEAGVSGGGLYIAAGTMSMTNTILSGNTRTASGVVSASNCAGTPIASVGGRNLDSGTTCGLGDGNLSNVDPLLGPLQANGGPTWTHALGAGSPAIDAGDNASCAAVDQRGEARPKDGNGDGAAVCDIGAFESAAVAPPPPSGSGGGGGGGGDGGGGGGGGGGIGPDVLVTFTASNAMPVPNEIVEIKATIFNKERNIGATGLRAVLTLPADVRLLGAPAFDRGSGCSGTTTLDCFLDYLPGNTETVLRFSIDVGAAGSKVISAKLTTNVSDADETNNTGSITLAVGTRGTTTVSTVPPAARPAAIRTITGSSRSDVLRGTTGRDVIRGLGGNDRLFGLGGSDRLLGGAGNDRIDGGSAADVLEGGAGDDVISARDGRRDVVRCGTGRDVVDADRADSVAKDCETVRRR